MKVLLPHHAFADGLQGTKTQGASFLIECKSKKKCCKKYKEGDQCKRCPKLAYFQEWIDNICMISVSK